MEFLAIFLGILAVIICSGWMYVSISTKRDQKKLEKKKCENRLRLSKIKKYLDAVSESVVDADTKHLLFKLKNRWEIIYGHFPYRQRHFRFPHPKLISACADRDNIEVKLMDKGIKLKYPE